MRDGWARKPAGDFMNISSLYFVLCTFVLCQCRSDKVSKPKYRSLRLFENATTRNFHYCQKCRAANPLGQEFCLRCGTRLMIVVQPPSVRVDVSATTPHEEHLLERHDDA